MSICLDTCSPGVLVWGILGYFDFEVPQFISKTHDVGVVSSPVYKWKGVILGCKFPRFPTLLLSSWVESIIRHTINKINITTSLNLGVFEYIKPYKGGVFIPHKFPKKTGQKVEVGNFDI